MVRQAGVPLSSIHSLFGEDEELGTKRPFRLELILFLFLRLRK